MASGHDVSYSSSGGQGQGQERSYVPSSATAYQGRDTNPAQQMRHDEFIDQVSPTPSENEKGYLQQIKTDEYLSQRNNLSGQGNNTNILQQTGEGVMNEAQAAVRGAANIDKEQPRP